MSLPKSAQGHYDELLGVLHEGVDVAQADTGGRLPLVFAAPQPNAFAHVLLLTGASVNDREPSTGMTALHAAVEARNYEVCLSQHHCTSCTQIGSGRQVPNNLLCR